MDLAYREMTPRQALFRSEPDSIEFDFNPEVVAAAVYGVVQIAETVPAIAGRASQATIRRQPRRTNSYTARFSNWPPSER
jgi:hypothetical protein